MSKILIGGLILILLGVGVWWFMMRQTSNTQNTAQNYQPTVSKSQTLPSVVPSTKSSGLSNKQDLSSSALDKDFSDIQGNLNKLDSDQKTASTDTSSQDTPPVQ